MNFTLPTSATDKLVVEFLNIWKLQGHTLFGLRRFRIWLRTKLLSCIGEAHDAKNGGNRVHGWALWQFGDVLVGNFHSVWECDDGTLHDVTPPKVGTSKGENFTGSSPERRQSRLRPTKL